MSDQKKTKEQLIQELQKLRQRVAELQESENQHKQVKTEIQGRLQEMTILSRVTAAVTSAEDMANALQNVCAELARFLQTPQSSFAILNPQRTAAEVIATCQPPDSPSTIGVVIPVDGNPSMAYILEHKTPLAITDAQTNPLLTPVHELMRQWNIQSILIVPIIVDGEVIGTLGLDAFQRRVFSDSEVNLVQHVASQVGQVLARKQAEDAQRESEEKYRVLVNTSVDGMISVDPQMKIILWNKGAERVFGYTEEEMLGQTLLKIVPRRYRKAKEKGFATFGTDGSGPVIGKTLELEGLRKDGTEIPIELSISPRRVGGMYTATAIVRDITERKRAADALQKAHEELEQYTDNLERRTTQLQVGAEVAREAAAILDVQQLLNTTVRLVSDKFGFYHAGAFLIDETGEYAVLRAASSEGGRRMLERGHKLAVGEVGIVGYVTATGEPRIALDVGQDATHLAHSDLPDTRSEMSLPLKVRGRTIGVLDVQDTHEAAFSEDEVAVLQTLGDQLAIAIENARLVERTEAQLRELSLLHGEYSAATWTELASPERSLGYVYDRIDVVPAEGLPTPALDLALTHGETVTFAVPDTAEKVLATPLKLRDQVIGTLGIQEADGGREWSPSEIALVEAVSEQVAQALESARLFADAQKSAQQMQALYEIGRIISRLGSLDETFQTLAEVLVEQVGYASSWLALVDDRTQTLKGIAGAGAGVTKDIITEQVPLDPQSHNPAVQAVLNREPVVINNVPTDGRAAGLDEKVRGVLGRMLEVPILVGGEAAGVIAVNRPLGTPELSNQDIEMLLVVADQAAVALQNTRLFEETQDALADTESLYQASRKLLSATAVADVFQSALESVTNTGTDFCFILKFGEVEGEDIEVMAIWDVQGFSPLHQGTNLPYELLAPVLEVHPLQTTVVVDIHQDERVNAMFLQLLEASGVKSFVGIPIQVMGKPYGAFVTGRRNLTPYEKTTIRRYEAIAAQTAVAIENLRLLEETQRRATQLAAAAEVARDATAILDVEQLLDETVHLISEQFGFYHAGVFLLDEQEEYAVLQAASSEGGSRMLARNHKLPVGKVGIVGYVAATGEPRIALDVGKDAMHFVNPDLPDTRSEMGLPLKVREQVIGVLDVQSTHESAFSEEDVAVLQTLADQLAAAIANARLFQEVRTDAMRRALINEMLQAAAASLDPDELLHRAGEAISRRLQRPSILFSWEPEEEVLRPVAVHDAYAADVPLANGLRVTRKMDPTLFSEVVDGRRICVLEPLAPSLDQPATTLAEQLGIQAWDASETGAVSIFADVYVPLTTRDQILGVLALVESDGRSPEGLDFVEIIGANLSVALENARLYQDAVETARQLKEMDRLKNQFLANMSHELRTPLNSIIGFSRVILKGIDGPLTDMQRTDLQSVYDSGQHLLGLINDILEISKIQAGKMELSFEDTDLREIIKGVMSTAIALVKDKPVELQQSVPQDLPTIRADSRRIRQVLLNLVGNATKFTEEGFIHVEAEASPTEVVISVTDSGIGIPSSKLGTIFDEFTQVDGSSTRRAGGTGLGLSITRHFVEMHGGRIWVESTSDIGTAFCIALPIGGPPEEAGKEGVEGIDGERAEETGGEGTEEAGGEGVEETSGEGAEGVGENRRVVLCVDDDEGVITLFRRYLSKQGYRVVGLTDSTAVVEKARQLDPFAITLDVMMPNKDGWQVIQELKADSNTRDIPVIMCTIIGDVHKYRGLSLGASGYLVKPILEADLVTALERLDREEEKEGDGHHLVLVVENQMEDRNLLRRMIESCEGYEVVEAASGQEAIALVRQARPNIIILDLMMPDVDGFAVLESVKANESTRSIPIIVVTAKDLTQEERDILNRRVEALLQKGLFEQQELLADVASALERITITNDK